MAKQRINIQQQPLYNVQTDNANSISGSMTAGVSVQYGWDGVTTSNFRVTMVRSSGAFANTSYYGYSWIAWGI